MEEEKGEWEDQGFIEDESKESNLDEENEVFLDNSFKFDIKCKGNQENILEEEILGGEDG